MSEPFNIEDYLLFLSVRLYGKVEPAIFGVAFLVIVILGKPLSDGDFRILVDLRPQGGILLPSVFKKFTILPIENKVEVALRGNLGGALCGNLAFALCGKLFTQSESNPEAVGNVLIPGDIVPEIRDLNMSRTSLYRRLKTLTGQSATEFIRHARLRKALNLMENGNFSIEEVSLSVGFNSHSYFSHCFRQHFGKTPSEFLMDKK